MRQPHHGRNGSRHVGKLRIRAAKILNANFPEWDVRPEDIKPATGRWRTDWRAAEPGPAERPRRGTLASQRCVAPGGALSPISAAELMALRTARSSKTP